MSEREQEITAEATERVEERLLDALLPAPAAPASATSTPNTENADATASPNIFLVGASGAATTAPISDAETDRHQRTREKLRVLLRPGIAPDAAVHYHCNACRLRPPRLLFVYHAQLQPQTGNAKPDAAFHDSGHLL